jgi:hypothetical protein
VALPYQRDGATVDARRCIICGRPLAQVGARGRPSVACSEDRPGPFVELPALRCSILRIAAGRSDVVGGPSGLAPGVDPTLLGARLQAGTRALKEVITSQVRETGSLVVPGEPAPDRRR